jgi:hypothetical protein
MKTIQGRVRTLGGHASISVTFVVSGASRSHLPAPQQGGKEVHELFSYHALPVLGTSRRGTQGPDPTSAHRVSPLPHVLGGSLPYRPGLSSRRCTTLRTHLIESMSLDGQLRPAHAQLTVEFSNNVQSLCAVRPDLRTPHGDGTTTLPCGYDCRLHLPAHLGAGLVSAPAV